MGEVTLTLEETDASELALLLDLWTPRGPPEFPAMKTVHALLLKHTLGGE